MASKLDKNVQIALKYASDLVGTKYRYWIEGENMLDGNEPFYVSTEPAPSVAYVKARSEKC